MTTTQPLTEADFPEGSVFAQFGREWDFELPGGFRRGGFRTKRDAMAKAAQLLADHAARTQASA